MSDRGGGGSLGCAGARRGEGGFGVSPRPWPPAGVLCTGWSSGRRGGAGAAGHLRSTTPGLRLSRCPEGGPREKGRKRGPNPRSAAVSPPHGLWGEDRTGWPGVISAAARTKVLRGRRARSRRREGTALPLPHNSSFSPRGGAPASGCFPLRFWMSSRGRTREGAVMQPPPPPSRTGGAAWVGPGP